MQKIKYKIIKSLNEHKISKTDKFFFDANVWLYILNDNSTKESKKYIEFLKKILETDALIITNQEVISEVISKFLKDDAKLKGFKDKYKEYRKTEYYRNCFKVISAIFLQLLDNKKLIFEPINFTNNDFRKYLEINTKEQQRNILDYKDYIYTIFSKNKNYIIVTNDKDFASLRFNNIILTANSKIIGKKIFPQN